MQREIKVDLNELLSPCSQEIAFIGAELPFIASGCKEEEWREKFTSEKIIEKLWGYQGFFTIENPNNPKLPLKLGFATVIRSFLVRQNRHIHPKTGEIMAIWTKQPNTCIVELNGQLYQIKDSSILYIPPNVPHDLILTGPGITIDIKGLTFNDRTDNISPDIIDPHFVDKPSITTDEILYYDPSYGIDLIFGIKKEKNSSNQLKTQLPLIKYLTIIFNPEEILQNPNSFPKYQILPPDAPIPLNSIYLTIPTVNIKI